MVLFVCGLCMLLLLEKGGGFLYIKDYNIYSKTTKVYRGDL